MLASGIESFVKIGYSDVCPWARVEMLAVGCPLPLEIIGILTGSRDLERLLHDQFDAYHVRGEWFRWKGAVIEHVNTMPAPDREAFHRGRKVQTRINGCVDCRYQFDKHRQSLQRYTNTIE